MGKRALIPRTPRELESEEVLVTLLLIGQLILLHSPPWRKHDLSLYPGFARAALRLSRFGGCAIVKGF
jgi:hypothetical protein